jgi:hypothetical protein
VTFVEAFWSLLTLPVNTNRVFCGYATDPAAPVNRILGAGMRANATPVQEVYCQADASLQGFVSDPTDDASAARIAENSVMGVGGLYVAGAFPTPYTTQGGIAEHASGPGGVQQPVNAQNNPGGLHVAFVTGTNLATMAATLERIRVSRVA